MRKTFLILSVTLFSLAIGYNVHNSQHDVQLLDLTIENVEAMAFCEITKGNKVRLKCDGEGTCSKSYLGYTLTCDGTEVK